MLSFLELDFEFVFEQVEMIDRIYIKSNALKEYEAQTTRNTQGLYKTEEMHRHNTTSMLVIWLLDR